MAKTTTFNGSSGHLRISGRARCLPPWWMKGIFGCFVFGDLNHRENEKQTREEVTEVIKRLKMKNPKSFLTLKDEIFISEMFSENATQYDDHAEDLDQAGEEQGDGEEISTEEGRDIFFISDVDLESIGESLRNSAFMPATSVSTDQSDIQYHLSHFT